MKTWVAGLILAVASGFCLAAELDRAPLEAVTVDGQKVRLFPNGRWAYADAAKAAEAQQVAQERAAEQAAQERAAKAPKHAALSNDGPTNTKGRSGPDFSM